MLNEVTLIGHLGADPELRATTNGKSVANFSLATNRVWFDKEGEKQEETEWHKIVVWGKSAENSKKFLRKGSMCAIKGRIKQRSWETDEGETKYITEIIAERVIFMGKNSGGGGGGRQDAPPPIDDDDLPF